MVKPVFIVNEGQFSRMVERFSTECGVAYREAFIDQGKLLVRELIQRTPPFSGKLIKKMTEAKGAIFSDVEAEELSAKQVGERRVEKDIRKVVYGLEGASLSARHNEVTKGSSPNNTPWGTLQKCEGKQAVRLFAGKDGTVYGADISQWFPNASISEIGMHHEAQRGKRGRVTMAGQRTRDVGRWRWLNVFVTQESMVASYVQFKQKWVGQAKGGWAAGLLKLGGKISAKGWIGRHMSAGTCEVSAPGSKRVSITITNNSKWASVADTDRVIEKSMEGRERALEGNIRRTVTKLWSGKEYLNTARQGAGFSHWLVTGKPKEE